MAEKRPVGYTETYKAVTMDYKELGRRLKAEHYPEYEDLTDEEVGRAYAIENDHVVLDDEPTTALNRIESSLPAYPTPQFPALTEETVSLVRDYYRPNRGVFTSWWQRRKSEGRNRLLEQLNAEQLKVIELGRILEQEVMAKRRSEVEFEIFVRQNALQLHAMMVQAQLMDNALHEGMDLPHHQDWILEGKKVDIRLKEERGKSDIEVEKHERLSNIDVRKDYETRMNQLRGLQELKKLPLTQLKDMRKEIKDLYLEQHDVEVSDLPESVKNRYLKLLDGTIETYEGKYNAERNRLHQDGNGQDLGGADPESEL
jgi:hypothetical protein